MKRFTLFAPALLVLACAPLQAQGPAEERMPESPQENVTEAFDNVDTDGNGILSIEEARGALPDLTIEDSNGDGWLNHAEVESAAPELELGVQEAGAHSVVGESDYLEIRQTITDPQDAS